MRRLFRILIAATILWSCAARGAELRIGLAADVTSMDPHFLNLQPNVNIGWHVFDALTHVDENARFRRHIVWIAIAGHSRDEISDRRLDRAAVPRWQRVPLRVRR